MRLRYRVGQALHYSLSGRGGAPDLTDDARALLTEPMLQQFRLLPAGDQRHLLRVFHYLLARNAEPDTVIAGLIHDVGKACGRCRITILDRTLHVLLVRYLSGPYARFARREESPQVLRGLHTLANHAARGARAAGLAGYNPRVCSLIRVHESGGDRDDLQLRLLREADECADRSWDTIKR